MSARRAPFVALVLLAAACASPPAVPAQPTWADVAPIVNGECSGCHGASADVAGAGYRLDFYDMTAETCGDAALGMGGGFILAGAAASNIGADVTPIVGMGRAKMPPLPGPSLADWERETLQRWASQPVKGAPPAGNRPPTIATARMPFVIDGQLAFTAIVDDPDGDAVVGALEIADVRFLMDRPGSFAVSLDSSAWPAGTQHLRAVLCDGWQSMTYDLGPIEVQH